VPILIGLIVFGRAARHPIGSARRTRLAARARYPGLDPRGVLVCRARSASPLGAVCRATGLLLTTLVRATVAPALWLVSYRCGIFADLVLPP